MGCRTFSRSGGSQRDIDARSVLQLGLVRCLLAAGWSCRWMDLRRVGAGCTFDLAQRGQRWRPMCFKGIADGVGALNA